MPPDAFLADIIDPGLILLAGLGGPARSEDARRFLLAIALQESGPQLDARYQGSPGSSPGPARGFWQFEQGGGVHGVLNHPSSAALALKLCKECCVVAREAAVWRALEGHDDLATGFARLLLWTDPHPIPTTEDAAWEAYAERLWRPGAPHRDAWAMNWQTASETIAAHPLAPLIA